MSAEGGGVVEASGEVGRLRASDPLEVPAAPKRFLGSEPPAAEDGLLA